VRCIREAKGTGKAKGTEKRKEREKTQDFEGRNWYLNYKKTNIKDKKEDARTQRTNKKLSTLK